MTLHLPCGRFTKTIIAMEADVVVERIGPDPFGRGEPTVFYRDYRINGGIDVFYLWVCHWKSSYPNVLLPGPPR